MIIKNKFKIMVENGGLLGTRKGLGRWTRGINGKPISKGLQEHNFWD
jgi:hypothetical protein